MCHSTAIRARPCLYNARPRCPPLLLEYAARRGSHRSVHSYHLRHCLYHRGERFHGLPQQPLRVMAESQYAPGRREVAPRELQRPGILHQSQVLHHSLQRGRGQRQSRGVLGSPPRGHGGGAALLAALDGGVGALRFRVLDAFNVDVLRQSACVCGQAEGGSTRLRLQGRARLILWQNGGCAILFKVW